MAIPVHDLLMEVSKLTELQDVRVAVRETFKGAALAGFSTLVGGFFLGPIGLVLGGAMGGLGAYAFAEEFKSIPHIIIHDLTPEQRRDLAASIRRCLAPIAISGVADFLQISRDATISASIAKEVLSFIKSQGGMRIVN